MKNLTFISILFISLVSVSCRSRKPVEPVILQNTKEVTKIVRDTIFKVEADSTFYSAYIECVNGKPIIKETSPKLPTGNLPKSDKALQEPKVNLTGNILNVECHQQAQQLYKQWRETYIKEHEQKPVYVSQVEYREKSFNTWQKVQLWFGRIFMGLLAISVFIAVLRKRRVI